MLKFLLSALLVSRDPHANGHFFLTGPLMAKEPSFVNPVSNLGAPTSDLMTEAAQNRQISMPDAELAYQSSRNL
jgi:hypothetical protein